jgi:glyoxylase-like metal-dependent hydrolase (beta-lactamase superfamily II)
MRKIASNVYASTEYPGANVGFIVMPAGAIAVDVPALPRDARAWRQQIVETADGPILYLVLTDGHPDRLLSARLLEAPIVAARGVHDRASVYTEGFWRGVVDGWARRYPEAAHDLAGAPIVLPEVMFTTSLTLRKGGADLTIDYVAGAAPGSAWVHLPEQGVLFAGDTLVVDGHPFLDAAPDTKAWLNTLTALRRPRFSRTTIVPGRGPLCDPAASRPLSDYIALARRRVRSLRAPGAGRVDMTAPVAEMLPLFPIAADERDLVPRRIKAGLDQLYREFHAD